MVRKEDAEEAVKDPNPTIDGRRANVNLAYMGAKNRTNDIATYETEERKTKISFVFSYSSWL